MEHTKHAAWQWNPPKQIHKWTELADEAFHSSRDILSATECTGLMQQVPENESEAHALSGLYSIHTVKPKGNIGKCNPNNDPDEIFFHRT